MRLPSWLKRTVLALVLAALAGLIAASPPGRALDRLLFGLTAGVAAAPAGVDTLLVAIDRASLREVGRWPWSRVTMARLIDRLTDAGVAAIGVNVVYGEPRGQEEDAALIGAVERNGKVALAMLVETSNAGSLLEEVLPFPALFEAAGAVGHSGLSVSPDGIVRRVELHAGLGGACWPNLALAVAVLAGREQPAEPGDCSLDSAQRAPWAWATDGARLMRLGGGGPRLLTVSASAVLDGRVDPEQLRGKLVIVSPTAANITGQVAFETPSGAVVAPAGRLPALVLDRMLQGELLRQAPPPLSAFALTASALIPYVALGMGWTALIAALAIPVAAAAVAVGAVGAWLPIGAVLVGAKLGLLGVKGQALARSQVQALIERNRAFGALQAIRDAVVILDPDARISFVNPAAARLVGATREDLIGQPLERASALRHLIDQAAEAWGGGDEAPLVERVDEDGQIKEYRAEAATLNRTRLGRPERVVTLSDVTSERRLVREVTHRATHDTLTGLPNRALLDETLSRTIAGCARRDDHLAVAFIDLDQLKRVNDDLGHAAGDELIKRVAARLRQEARAEDTVARLGGDEFVVVLPSLTEPRLAIDAVERLLKRVQRPLELSGRRIHPQASVGIAHFPGHGETGDLLLRRADAAMYLAKRRQSGRIAVWSPEAVAGKPKGGLALVEDLREGLGRDEVVVHYQPRVRMSDRKLSGFEALARWRHPRHGLLLPGSFVPLAEETGLMVELGRQVLALALSEAANALRGDDGLRLSVNLSAVQLEQDRHFVKFVERQLILKGVQPQRLELEVTESLFLDPKISPVARRLQALAALGCSLAIDDFGTGYSSLGYLARFPFDRIKIDRSFTADLSEGKGSAAIVEAIVGLGRALAKPTTAEGVEREDQFERLKAQGCEEAQGYLFAKPMPFKEARSKLVA